MLAFSSNREGNSVARLIFFLISPFVNTLVAPPFTKWISQPFTATPQLVLERENVASPAIATNALTRST
jgi:hypothetical protein